MADAPEPDEEATPDGAFDRVTGLLDYPMFVVTAVAGGERSGCLVGFATQVSIDPPRFLVAMSDKNRTYRVAAHAGRLAVHVLAAGQDGLARLFGERTGDEVDKFGCCRWHAGPDGVPVLDDALGWFTGPVVDRVAFGDHVGFVIAPDGGATPADAGELLGFQRARAFEPGHGA